MKINERGFWENENVSGEHHDDKKLAPYLIKFFKSEKAKSIVDLGCGNAFYVKEMRKNGLHADGFDGNPHTPLITGNVANLIDLSQITKLDTDYDWVLSLEVGEHLPPKFEDNYIKNLHINNKKGIILSWAVEGQGGTGHFNEKNNDYIKKKFKELNYDNDLESEKFLRANSGLKWFKNTIMVFRKQE